MLYSTALPALLALPGASAQLNKLAQAAGKLYFGSATDNGELTDTAYLAILSDADEFGQIVSAKTLSLSPSSSRPKRRLSQYIRDCVWREMIL